MIKDQNSVASSQQDDMMSSTPIETARDVGSNWRRFQNNPKAWLIFGIVAILLLGVFAAVSQIGLQQNIRKKTSITGVRLTLVPSQITSSANKEYTVAITINTGGEIVSAANLNLSFDPTKLEVQNIVHGNFLPIVLVQGKVMNGTASITLGSQPTKPKKGEGVLAILKIKSLGQTTAITFSSTTQVAAIGKSGNVVEQLVGLTVSGDK